MAIRYYDDALTEKIKAWVKDPNMTILSPNQSTRLFQLEADINYDKPLTLPLIAISRDPTYEILTTTKRALTYDGPHVEATKRKSELLNGIPIRIGYQLDIYTKYFAEADEYTRNFIFNLINYPNVRIEIPYNQSRVVHNSTIVLNSSVTDNSDIPERLVPGQFTRMSIRFNIDDAYLFSVPFMDNWYIDTYGVVVDESDSIMHDSEGNEYVYTSEELVLSKEFIIKGEE